MYKQRKIIGIVPARGGSKGLKDKNIYPLAGKPLIAWSIEQGLKSKYLDTVIVSTDSQRIAAVAKKYRARVPFMRPGQYATDQAKSVDVIEHAIRFMEAHGERYDYICLLEPTSPLRETSDVDNAIKLLVDNEPAARSVLSVSKVEAAHPAFDVVFRKNAFIKPYVGNDFKVLRRQEIKDLYYFDGTVYVSEIKELLKKRTFCHRKTLGYIVPRWKALEIDEMVDMVWAEAIIKNKEKII